MLPRTKKLNIPTPPPPFTSTTPIPFPTALQNPHAVLAPPPQAQFLFQPLYNTPPNAAGSFFNQPPLHQFPPFVLPSSLQTHPLTIQPTEEYGQPVQLGSSTSNSPPATPTSTNNPPVVDNQDNVLCFHDDQNPTPSADSDSESSSPLSTCSSDSSFSSSFDSDPISSQHTQESTQESQTPFVITPVVSDDDTDTQLNEPQPQTTEIEPIHNSEQTPSADPATTASHILEANEAIQFGHGPEVLSTITVDMPPAHVPKASNEKKGKAKKPLSLSKQTPCSTCTPVHKKKQAFTSAPKTVKHLDPQSIASPSHSPAILTALSGAPLPVPIANNRAKKSTKPLHQENYISDFHNLYKKLPHIPTQKAISKLADKAVSYITKKYIPWQKFIMPCLSIVGAATLYFGNFWRISTTKVATEKFFDAGRDEHDMWDVLSAQNLLTQTGGRLLHAQTCPVLIFYTTQPDGSALKYIKSILAHLQKKHFLWLGIEEPPHWTKAKAIAFFTDMRDFFEESIDAQTPPALNSKRLAEQDLAQNAPLLQYNSAVKSAVHSQEMIFLLQSLDQIGIKYFSIGDDKENIDAKVENIRTACDTVPGGLVLLLYVNHHHIAAELKANEFLVSEYIVANAKLLSTDPDTNTVDIFADCPSCASYYIGHNISVLQISGNHTEIYSLNEHGNDQ